MSDNGEQHWIRLIYSFNVPLEDGSTQPQLLHLRLPLITAWRIIDAIHRLENVEQAIMLGKFALSAARIDPSIENPLPSEIEAAKLETAITFLANLLPKRWDSLDDRVLEFTYQLLRLKFMSRETAAKFASIVLGRRYDTDAYRKKVDRWVKSHGRQPIGQTKRRPRKQIR